MKSKNGNLELTKNKNQDSDDQKTMIEERGANRSDIFHVRMLSYRNIRVERFSAIEAVIISDERYIREHVVVIFVAQRKHNASYVPNDCRQSSIDENFDVCY